MERVRPKDEKVRQQLDIAYRVEGQSVYIFEMRPDVNGQIRTHDVAKTTFVRTENIWKVYWMRSDLKWHVYETTNLKTINGFVKAVETDRYGVSGDEERGPHLKHLPWGTRAAACDSDKSPWV